MSETCENCKFSRLQNGILECHRYPATVGFIGMAGQKGAQPVSAVASWGPVRPDQWCGEHRVKIHFAAQLPAA